MLVDAREAPSARFAATNRPLASIVILTQNNTALLRGCLASLARSIDSNATPYEVLVHFNGTPHDVTAGVAAQFRGARITRTELNLGFAAGNNYAARAARGEYLVFLNDDTMPQKDWLRWLITAAQGDPEAGAIGSRILFPDGTVQEAGGIIWSDGSTRPLGRGESHRSLAYTYVRPVDYVSANGMLVRRASFEAIGGFSTAYFPAYYEDVDLCLRVRHVLGQHVLYEPRSEILHIEAASTKDNEFRSFLFRRNQATLQKTWSHVLPTYAAPEPESPAAVERAVLRRLGSALRVLVLDDRLPDPGRNAGGLGSGFSRTREIFLDLRRNRELAVAFYPSAIPYDVPENNVADLGVDLVTGDLRAHLSRPEKSYDLVIVSRPHNFENFIDLLEELLPDARILYDAEALYHKRLWMEARLERDARTRESIEDEARQMEELETAICRRADRLVCISHDELAWMRGVAGHAPIDLMVPLLSDIAMGPSDPLAREHAIYVAGWLAGDASPNVGALRWYVDEVLPRVRRAVPGFKTLVTGKNPPPSVTRMAGAHRGVELAGFVRDLEDFYGRARVAIAPNLVGAGVKIKVMEALEFGVPVVATNVGAEGLGLSDGLAIDISDDPAVYAQRLVTLLTDATAWRKRRSAIESVVARWQRERVTWDQVVARTMQAPRRKAARSA